MRCSSILLSLLELVFHLLPTVPIAVFAPLSSPAEFSSTVASPSIKFDVVEDLEKTLDRRQILIRVNPDGPDDSFYQSPQHL